MIIVIPLDGSPLSEQVLARAMCIARELSAEVHLVRVHSPTPVIGFATMPSNDWQAYDEAMQAVEWEYVNGRAAHLAERHSLTVVPFLLHGAVVDGIAAHVRTHDADLVVMTTHGRGGISRAWLGSVAERLIRDVSVPILLQRPMREPDDGLQDCMPTRILVPLDGSAIAESGLTDAIRMGGRSGASYTLMQVVSPPVAASAESWHHMQLDAAALRSDATAYLESIAAAMRAHGHVVDTRVIVQSNVAAAIVEEAMFSHCDMIAMATHGRSGLSRIAMGSVADKVLRTTPVPFLVVRPNVTSELIAPPRITL